MFLLLNNVIVIVCLYLAGTKVKQLEYEANKIHVEANASKIYSMLKQTHNALINPHTGK